MRLKGVRRGRKGLKKGKNMGISTGEAMGMKGREGTGVERKGTGTKVLGEAKEGGGGWR
jgi:hypothetical protein